MGEGPRWPAYVLRASLAATFLLAGLDHAVDDGSMAWAVRWFPWPEPAGLAVAWGELLAGLGLAAGALFVYAAGAAAFIALGAATTVLVEDGNLVWQNLLMAGAAFYVLAHGPGPGSFDEWLARRRPDLARWLALPQGEALRRFGSEGFRIAVAAGLLGIFALSVLQGLWTSTTGARLSPELGVALFWLRPLAGLLLLAGVAPRLAGGILLLSWGAHAASAPFEYHGFILLGTAAVLLVWPRAFIATPSLPWRHAKNEDAAGKRAAPPRDGGERTAARGGLDQL